MTPLIYARVSTADKQDYARQVNQLIDVCKKHGYETPPEVFAESVSGYNKTDRHQLDAMLERVKSNPKEFIIYISELSRLGRNPTTTRQILDQLTDWGVSVYIQSLNQYTLENGKRNMIMNIILQVLLEFSNAESLQTKERSRQGLRQSAMNGKAQGSLFLPYGYAKDAKGMMVLEPTEAEIISEIFELYATGRNGIKVISNILNERGVPTRMNKSFKGKEINFKVKKDASRVKWSDKTIHDILRNTIYIGKRKWKGEVIEAPQLRIVTDELFEDCKAIMTSKTHKNYINRHLFLLQDLCTCGCCNRNYFGRYKPHKLTVTKKGEKKDAYENTYICSSRLVKGGSCDNTGVNLSLIETAIYTCLSDAALVRIFLDDTNNVKAELLESITQLEQSFKLENYSLSNKAKEKERLLDVYLSNGIPKNVFSDRQTIIDKDLTLIAKRVETIEKSLKENKKALFELENTKMDKQALQSFRDNRKQLQLYFKRLIKTTIINKLDNNHVLATMFLNVNSNPDDKSWVHNSLKLLLDTSGVRRKPITYRFKTAYLLDVNPTYINGILQTNKDDLIEAFSPLEWIELEDELSVE